ncbi:MAG: AtpZ/AtpI family protein [Acidobacteriota bacterium]|nr:AtpZ/AtpI family protein [Acidobacteriota bacterium]
MIKNLLDADENPPEGTKVIIEETTIETVNDAPVKENFTDTSKFENNAAVPFQTARFESESQAETMRKSGLAYGAAITLFASVVFMMIIGWFADLLMGTSPWGIVGGIVLGATIGFVQFFRMTAQILKNKD